VTQSILLGGDQISLAKLVDVCGIGDEHGDDSEWSWDRAQQWTDRVEPSTQSCVDFV
jgi:hypothetical protein